MKRVNFKFKSTALVLLALGLSSNLWGYEIVFTTSGNESTSLSTSTSASSIVTSASQTYVTGNLATATKLYGPSTGGLKCGASSSAGAIKINLSTAGQVTPTSIDVYAYYYNSTKKPTLSVNGSTTQTVSASTSTKYTFNITSAITYIQLNTNKYCWIQKIVVNSASTYDATFVSDHGTAPSKATGVSSVTLQELSASGWAHTGWTADKSVTVGGVAKTAGTALGKTDVCTLSANTTFTAQWVAACSKEISISKGVPSNGSFDMTPTGTICIDEGNASVSLSNIAGSTHYHPTVVTVSGGGSPNIGTISAGSATVSNISADATINVTFVEDTKYTIQFTDGIHSQTVDSKQVYEGDTFDFPTITDRTEKTSGTCEEVHYHFMGWVISTHAGEITAGDIKTGKSEAVSAAATYKAVWAAKDTSK